ncbi:MAG: P-loop NTPase [Deltaproteobacteria bacterium]|nr:P-loop NTPase [Deltaproteobacteria bacterium]
MSFFNRVFYRQDTAIDADQRERPSGAGGLVMAGRVFRPSIWAVGGGKGGVGKSLVAANLAIMLTRTGRRVLLVDADLGASNLHTFLGIEGASKTLTDLLAGKAADLKSVANRTLVPNLDLVSGAQDSLDAAEYAAGRLCAALRGSSGYDVALLDMGPGTSPSILDLFLTADNGILLTTPEPTSVENTYRFLKSLFLRRMKNILNGQEAGPSRALLEKALQGRSLGEVKTISDILAKMKTPGSDRQNFLGDAQLSIIVNQTRSIEDKRIGPSMMKAGSDYFGVEINHLGDILFEDSVPESVRKRRPLALHYGSSGAAMAMEVCLKNLLSRDGRSRRGRA